MAKRKFPAFCQGCQQTFEFDSYGDRFDWVEGHVRIPNIGATTHDVILKTSYEVVE